VRNYKIAPLKLQTAFDRIFQAIVWWHVMINKLSQTYQNKAKNLCTICVWLTQNLLSIQPVWQPHYRIIWKFYELCYQRLEKTRSSAIAEGPRDASCQFKFANCHTSAETTCTTSPKQIKVMKLKRYSKAMCNKRVHSAMTDRVAFVSCRCHKQTDDGRVVDITCIPTTCCGEIF